MTGDSPLARMLSVACLKLRAISAWTVVFLVVLLVENLHAKAIVVPPLPVSPHLDTEVSTNIVLHTAGANSRIVDLHIQFDGNTSNDLEIGFGADVNTNGVLDVEEIETVYGWRGGRYFIENVRTWERFETDAAYNAQRNAPVAEGDQVGRMSEANEPQSGRKSPRVVDIHMVLDSNSAPPGATVCSDWRAFGVVI